MNPTVLETPCREWQGPFVGKGYGAKTRRVLIHRWVWEQINGPIPKGMVVMHRCDNPPCFRYDHLQLGTYAENNADMYAKGRGSTFWVDKTHCPHGHPYDEENTRYKTARDGYVHRACKACDREYNRRRPDGPFPPGPTTTPPAVLPPTR